MTLLILDLFGTFVFALSGAMVGVQRRLDIFGVFVLAFAAGNAGGVLRDLLLGSVPPLAIADWRYLGVSVLAGVLVFYKYHFVDRLRSAVLIFDGAGLALFSVNGTLKALQLGLGPVPAAILGMLSGVGGGVLRDVLSNETPAILRGDFYATAALIGAVVVVIGHGLSFPQEIVALAGASACFGLRLSAVRRGWKLPLAGNKGPSN